MIVQNITDDGKFASLTFTVPIEDEKRAVKELKMSRLNLKILIQKILYAKYR